MEKTPKLPRKSLTLTTRRRNRTSASPGSRIQNTSVPTTPISPECDLNCTPPHRRFIFNPPYSPTNDLDFSPRSNFSQSSTNSPDVTWRWTQDDSINDNKSPSSAIAKSASNSNCVKDLRKKRSVERKEEIRKAEIEKRKANRNKRDIALKQQCEQMELLIMKTGNRAGDVDSVESPAILKERSLSNSSGYGSNTNIDNVFDLLNDSESDGLLLEATQQVETQEQEQVKITCKEEEPQRQEQNKSKGKRSECEFLHDSLDDWFASLDADLLAAQPNKQRSSLQRYKSMPTESPTAPQNSETAKMKRYPSSNAFPPKTCYSKRNIFCLLRKKLKENQRRVRCGQVGCFRNEILRNSIKINLSPYVDCIIIDSD